MTITFENDNDVIFDGLETIISYAKRTEQIFFAQCVWWLASIIGLEQGLVNHIDNLHQQTIISKERHLEEVNNPMVHTASIVRDSTPEGKMEGHQHLVLKECEEYLKESCRLRYIAALNTKGNTRTGRINPTAITKKALRKKFNKPAKDNLKTEGISETEIQRRKGTGECLCCAWPADRKGAHRVKDCIRPIKLGKGTACWPKKKSYPLQGSPEPSTSSGEDLSLEDSSEGEQDLRLYARLVLTEVLTEVVLLPQ
jgi:hypothetical protein